MNREQGKQWAEAMAERKAVVTRRKADCDCITPNPSNLYVCEDCSQDILICEDCRTILKGCECGHCEKGATFYES